MVLRAAVGGREGMGEEWREGGREAVCSPHPAQPHRAQSSRVLPGMTPGTGALPSSSWTPESLTL